jgi:hypothetical protein
LAPSRLHGALSEQVLPEPVGEAYSTVGVAAYAGLGAAIAAQTIAPTVPSTPGKPVALEWNNGIGSPSRMAGRPGGRASARLQIDPMNLLPLLELW